ncbi:GNAT family N-acetyltransferase [Vibrio sp. VB16]|uniref:GNAT family N-acetyltransferase n=1 Tax=Vibrio sp. VB16 TaxID=2785746 RepID=UPI0018A0257A|nr:GNAT family N-acetyltransferase [Vibrio sp. VB16]UGA54064.1 GNAT family N-acetyltransferase [Vibrio sp. VB16]
MDLELRKITHDTFYQICQLEVAPDQVNHVDSNAISLAEANFMESPWYRGIYVDGLPVGFILVDVNIQSGKCSLWRLMLDKCHQSKGYGINALRELTSELQSEFGIASLYTSVVPAKNGPIEFYHKCGFERTGLYVEGREVELHLSIQPIHNQQIENNER